MRKLVQIAAVIAAAAAFYWLVVLPWHGNLVLRRCAVAFEQQILERALQARHVLRQALAAVLLRLVLGLRHVVQQVHRAQRRGEADDDQRDGDLERRGN